jgi:hypothetical protein
MGMGFCLLGEVSLKNQKNIESSKPFFNAAHHIASTHNLGNKLIRYAERYKPDQD